LRLAGFAGTAGRCDGGAPELGLFTFHTSTRFMITVKVLQTTKLDRFHLKVAFGEHENA
jgi:hypothetical protein